MSKYVLIISIFVGLSQAAYPCDLQFDGRQTQKIVVQAGATAAVDVDGQASLLVTCLPSNVVIEGAPRVATLSPGSCMLIVNKGAPSLIQCEVKKAKNISTFIGRDRSSSGIFGCNKDGSYNSARIDAFKQCAEADFSQSQCFEVSHQFTSAVGFCKGDAEVIVEGRR